jgi:nitrogen-specific signal transduction histidine kinase
MRTLSEFSRWLFVILSALIVSLIAWNTYKLFTQLKENERHKMSVWASAFEEFQQVDITNKDWNSKLILNILQGNTTTPMILYTHKEDTYSANNLSEKVLQDSERRQALIEQFSSEFSPIEIRYNNELLQTIYYGNSPTITKIKYYPIVLSVILLLFYLGLVFFYNTSKSAEQNKLWAGMAKETAHQIGTPLSSLVGWTELLKSQDIPKNYITEIENDINRLKQITNRFSKIGSTPTLVPMDIVSLTRETCDYLKSRSSNLIEFSIKLPSESITAELNAELFSWTLENLVKNGIDAMRGQGTIDIALSLQNKRILLHISDSGKGIPKRNFNKIFNPGFTTKKRGWGLGLSLARRIIEDYHRGKIRVLKSVKDQGSTLEINLPHIS